MFKKFLMLSVSIFGLFLLVSPVFAVTFTSSSGKNSLTATSIACVGQAVATREASIASAFADHTASVQAAYTTRANELAGAYSNTTVDAVKAGVKVAWADFKKTVRSANSEWKGDRDAAWKVFRSAVSTCKAPSGVSDSSNSSTEPKGE